MGVAGLGRADAAAARRHAPASRLPHPRRCAPRQGSGRLGRAGGRSSSLACLPTLLLLPALAGAHADPVCSALPLPPVPRAEIEVEVPVEHGLLVENLLDLAHAPFTHTSTFARGWPVRRHASSAAAAAARVCSGTECFHPALRQSFPPPPVGLCPAALGDAPPTPARTHARTRTTPPQHHPSRRRLQVPDAVKFHASRLLGGNWDPYPIEMSFNPPCMTLSHVGLARPGKAGVVRLAAAAERAAARTAVPTPTSAPAARRAAWRGQPLPAARPRPCRARARRRLLAPLPACRLQGATPQDCQNHLHQLHVCLPSRAGHTRLLYRMATDFLWWTELLPGIQHFWRYIAGQVRRGAGARAGRVPGVCVSQGQAAPPHAHFSAPPPSRRCWARTWCSCWGSRTACCGAATPGATRCRTTSWLCGTAAGATPSRASRRTPASADGGPALLPLESWLPSDPEDSQSLTRPARACLQAERRGSAGGRQACGRQPAHHDAFWRAVCPGR